MIFGGKPMIFGNTQIDEKRRQAFEGESGYIRAIVPNEMFNRIFLKKSPIDTMVFESIFPFQGGWTDVGLVAIARVWCARPGACGCQLVRKKASNGLNQDEIYEMSLEHDFYVLFF